jgi:hypothetical protein
MTFALTGIVGRIYFLSVRGFLNVFLALIIPGLGFGPLTVMRTDFVLTGSYTRRVLMASLIPLFSGQ